jgi:molybdenum cofactor biosynthesis protein B
LSKTANEHKKVASKKLNFAIFICSTSRHRQKKEKIKDISGEYIKRTLMKAGHNVVLKKIIADDETLIINALEEVLNSPDLHVAIFSGGTGINPTDITIETLIPFLEKKLPGFGEIFRQISYKEIGSAALLSRAIAGVVKGKIIYCIPGSPNAARVSVERLILPESAHIVKHLRE